jgi:hypothetical protein
MVDKGTVVAHMDHLLWDQTFVLASIISIAGIDSTCDKLLIEETVLYTTIADEYERPMKYVSGFCKFLCKKYQEWV